MTAVGQVKRAVAAAIKAAGCAAIESYSEEQLKRYATAVAAVGTKETVIEESGAAQYLGEKVDEATQETVSVYGRKMLLTLLIEALRALDHFGDGVGATVQEGCRAVGNIGIGVDAHARMVLIAGGSRVQGDLLKEVGGSERTHAAEDTDDLFITHGEAPFLSFRAAFDRDSGARRARGHAG